MRLLVRKVLCVSVAVDVFIPTLRGRGREAEIKIPARTTTDDKKDNTERVRMSTRDANEYQ